MTAVDDAATHGAHAGGSPASAEEGAGSGPSLEQVAALVGGQRRRVRRAAAIAGGLGLAVGAAGVAVGSALSSGDEGSSRASVDLTTVAAESRDVDLYTAYAGTLGYGDAVTLVTRGDGVLTSVPALGTDVSRGEVAFDIDEQPVALLYGDLPAWRTLNEGVDDGPDVLQLETNLAALGYGDNLTVDEHFTSVTAARLKEFEAAIGQSDPDGELEPGEVVFSAGPVRVDDVLTRGTSVSAGNSVITGALLSRVSDTVASDVVTSTEEPTQSVTFTIASSDQGGFAVGDAVVVEMADGTLVNGVVSELSDTPRRNGTGPSADLVLDATVSITEVPDTGLIEGPANVRITDQVKNGLTMVPVRALVALAEGGYAVQVVGDDGQARYVGVETGLFQDGWVQITGAVKPGDKVEVPA